MLLKVHSAEWRALAALANSPWLLLLAVLLAELLDRVVAVLSPAEGVGEGTLPAQIPKCVVQLLLSDASQDGAAAVRAIDATCCLHWPHRSLQVRPRAGARVRSILGLSALDAAALDYDARRARAAASRAALARRSGCCGLAALTRRHAAGASFVG